MNKVIPEHFYSFTFMVVLFGLCLLSELLPSPVWSFSCRTCCFAWIQVALLLVIIICAYALESPCLSVILSCQSFCVSRPCPQPGISGLSFGYPFLSLLFFFPLKKIIKLMLLLCLVDFVLMVLSPVFYPRKFSSTCCSEITFLYGSCWAARRW